MLNIWRDALLIFLVLLPVVVALVFRFLLPELEDTLQTRLDFNLRPYHPMLMAVFVGMAPAVMGSLYGLMLVDERDERTLAVLRVMPVPFASYLFARMLLPSAFSLVITVATYPLAGLTPLPLPIVAVIATAAATVVPVGALTVINFAPNKVAGLAIFRVINMVLALPAFAYITPPVWQPAAWIVPAYWPMEALWLADSGQSFGWALLIAVAMNALLGHWLYRRFNARAEP